MMFKKMKYIYLSVLSLVAAGMMGACSDAEFPIDNDEEAFGGGSYEGDMLMVNITLDNMGGATTRVNEEELKEWENYVDPEKIRVLIFDENDKFLFESKSRWIRQLDPAVDHSVWSVSIPMYSNANDKGDYDWDWPKIREKLTEKKFKIAILANRPDREWNFGILEVDDEGNDQPGSYVVPNGWFGSVGPDWTKENSVVYNDGKGDVKDVFDLHHCQYDPIYHGKNFYTTAPKYREESANGAFYDNYKNVNFNFYGAVTEDATESGNRPYMGATSSWVDWGENDQNNRDPNNWNYRKAALPGKNRPIPMYGIQEYQPLAGWKKGTTINLTRKEDKAISLLRSVVKLELAVPSGTVDDVTLFYSNIYARCEPMDVWTPTDRIWVANHDEGCEWELLKTFRMTDNESPNHQREAPKDLWDITVNPPVLKTKPKITTDVEINLSKADYQKRLTFLYGIWRKEKNWNFEAHAGGKIEVIESERYPRIFNPCIQRNNVLYVEKTYTESGYDYYVVYTGERNINDPSNLGQVGNTGGGNPTVIYWCMTKGLGANGKTYSMPIIDYSRVNLDDVRNTLAVSGVFTSYSTDGKNVDWGPANSKRSTSPGNNPGTHMGDYLIQVQGKDGSINSSMYPLPLVRNHVYRITLTGPTGTSSLTKGNDGTMGFSVAQFEDNYTKDIHFQ